MVELPAEIEIQRVMNLVRGFGWKKSKEEIEGKTIKITITKTMVDTDFTEGSAVPS